MREGEEEVEKMLLPVSVLLPSCRSSQYYRFNYCDTRLTLCLFTFVFHRVSPTTILIYVLSIYLWQPQTKWKIPTE